jgi:hypothetical protein
MNEHFSSSIFHMIYHLSFFSYGQLPYLQAFSVVFDGQKRRRHEYTKVED